MRQVLLYCYHGLTHAACHRDARPRLRPHFTDYPQGTPFILHHEYSNTTQLYIRPYLLPYPTCGLLALRRVYISISWYRGILDCLNGQANDESCSAPFAVAAGLHRAAVMLYDMFDDRKSQSQPTELPPSAAVGLSETIEDVR